MILQRLKLIDGYTDYSINDDRYLNIICDKHYCAINERGSHGISNYLIKVMVDSGECKTKICFTICVIPTGNITSVKRKRASYAEGGILNKATLSSGINKCIMCFCTLEIK